MKNKKYKEIIKKSINLDFNDSTSFLIEYNEKNIYTKKKRNILKYGLCFSLIIITIGVSLHFNNKPSKINYSNHENVNKIYVNDINYIDNFDYDIMDEKIYNLSRQKIEYEDLKKLFNYKLNLDYNKVTEIVCSNNTISKELVQCEISYQINNGFVSINLKNNDYPTFSTESTDNWKKNNEINKTNISKINNYDMYIIKNNNSNQFIYEYLDKKTTNYRTKFIINNIGFSIESYEIDLDSFINIIEIILDN